MAGDIRARNNEQERRARHDQSEAMNTLGHFQLPIGDCRLTSDCHLAETNRHWQSEIGNALSVSSTSASGIRLPASSAKSLAVPTRSRQTRSQPSLIPWQKRLRRSASQFRLL